MMHYYLIVGSTEPPETKEIKMLTIYIRSNETGEVVATHTAATNAECEAWAMEHYDINDYSWSYCA